MQRVKITTFYPGWSGKLGYRLSDPCNEAGIQLAAVCATKGREDCAPRKDLDQAATDQQRRRDPSHAGPLPARQ